VNGDLFFKSMDHPLLISNPDSGLFYLRVIFFFFVSLFFLFFIPMAEDPSLSLFDLPSTIYTKTTKGKGRECLAKCSLEPKTTLFSVSDILCHNHHF
jgi:hypothetical protein